MFLYSEIIRVISFLSLFSVMTTKKEPTCTQALQIQRVSMNGGRDSNLWHCQVASALRPICSLQLLPNRSDRIAYRLTIRTWLKMNRHNVLSHFIHRLIFRCWWIMKMKRIAVHTTIITFQCMSCHVMSYEIVWTLLSITTQQAWADDMSNSSQKSKFLNLMTIFGINVRNEFK